MKDSKWEKSHRGDLECYRRLVGDVQQGIFRQLGGTFKAGHDTTDIGQWAVESDGFPSLTEAKEYLDSLIGSNPPQTRYIFALPDAMLKEARQAAFEDGQPLAAIVRGLVAGWLEGRE